MRGPASQTVFVRRRIVIDPDKCCGCTACMSACRIDGVLAYNENTKKVEVVDPLYCAGCLMCMQICPAGAISHTKTSVEGAESIKQRES